MGEEIQDTLKEKARIGMEGKYWSTSGGCGPALDAAEAWTRMGDTCCGNETNDLDSH
ncbi:hypothetical protein GCM10011507_27810 [Edaphobacter acidisoli]|uniref:Uncharacterized protein n=1 Tax=Edaphobacter acidisoli TaxID=2040573 RepID=A0A916RXC3_9BACT|nr:hypothetical protein [Edaphobacter acidisoli]GGA74871.1 hypothetical protein GCM10011507_27810 [Edaphobacter acidisoli]